jgi:hypothetical protein
VNRQSRWNANQLHKTMVARYGPNYRRRRPSVEKFPENMVKVEFMHSIDEIQIYHKRYHLASDKPKWTRIDMGDEDTPGVFRVDWDHSAIMQLAFDYYGEDCAGQLEYYNYQTNNWQVIPDDIYDDMDMVTLYKGKGNRSMPLRLPSDFDDGHVSDDDMVDEEKLTKKEQFERAEAEAVRIIFRRLMDRLRRGKYVRISETTIGCNARSDQSANNNTVTLTIINAENGDDTTSQDHNDNESHATVEDTETTATEDMTIISTKQWIVKQAENDEFLASLLLSRPGALRHLVQCIHWDLARK